MTSIDENETWLTPHTSHKKRKGRHLAKISLSSRLSSVQDSLNPSWLDNCTKILEQRIEGTQKHSVTCLGLGSPESSDNARVQLAFLLKICDAFDIEYFKISTYDPVFSDEDRSLFEELEIHVLNSSDSDSPESRSVDGPTVLFMPHCDLTLYESVLSTNWSFACLSNILFICNHFDDYLQHNSTRYLEIKAPHLLAIASRITSISLPTSPDWPGAFNNTSIQFLSAEAATALLDSWVAMEPREKDEQAS